MRRAMGIIAVFTPALLSGCGADSTSPTTPTPPAMTASITTTFDENPVPFRTSGCSFSTPQGWFTSAKLQETAGVSFTPATLTQKLDGGTVSVLSESFSSRFGACSGMDYTPGVILASGSVCGVVGICTASTYSTYQFSIAGTDANGHTVTFDSPVLRLSAGPAGLSTSVIESAPARTRAPSYRFSGQPNLK